MKARESISRRPPGPRATTRQMRPASCGAGGNAASCVSRISSDRKRARSPTDEESINCSTAPLATGPRRPSYLQKIEHGVHQGPSRRQGARAHEPVNGKLSGGQRVSHQLVLKDRLERDGDPDHQSSDSPRRTNTAGPSGNFPLPTEMPRTITPGPTALNHRNP